MSRVGLRLIVRSAAIFINEKYFFNCFVKGNKVTKQIDKAADKVEEVATGESPRWVDKVNYFMLMILY